MRQTAELSAFVYGKKEKKKEIRQKQASNGMILFSVVPINLISGRVLIGNYIKMLTIIYLYIFIIEIITKKLK